MAKNVDIRELEPSTEDTSTRWTNHGDGSLRATYLVDGQPIGAEMWLSPQTSRVRLVLKRDGSPPLEANHPDILAAMEAADAFASVPAQTTGAKP